MIGAAPQLNENASRCPAVPRNLFAIIDIEASSLDSRSFPIEIAWWRPGSDVTSRLIQPAFGWDRRGWSEKSEAVHGIHYEELLRNGVRARQVVEQLDRELAGCVMLSDNASWDEAWLRMLYEAASATFAFRVVDFVSYLSQHYALDDDAVRRELRDLDARAPRAHRAGADVERLAAVYRLLAGGNAWDDP